MVEIVKGFTCPVAQAELCNGHHRTGIGVSWRGDELVIAITHAEFGTLAAFLSDELLGKLADLLQQSPRAENDR